MIVAFSHIAPQVSGSSVRCASSGASYCQFSTPEPPFPLLRSAASGHVFPGASARTMSNSIAQTGTQVKLGTVGAPALSFSNAIPSAVIAATSSTQVSGLPSSTGQFLDTAMSSRGTFDSSSMTPSDTVSLTTKSTSVARTSTPSVLSSSRTSPKNPCSMISTTNPQSWSFPITTSLTPVPLTTLDPSGLEATSSAHVLQTNIVLASRAASNYVLNPSNSGAKSTALAAVATAGLFAGHFKVHLPDIGKGGGGRSSGSCKSGGGLLKSLIGAVSCVAHNLDDITSGIKGAKDIEDDLKDLGGMVKPLDPKLPTPSPPLDAKPISPSDTTPEEKSDERENQKDDGKADKDEDDNKSSQATDEPSSSDGGQSSTASRSSVTSSSGTTSRTTFSSSSGTNSTLMTTTRSTTSSTPMSVSKTQYIIFASTKVDVNSLGTSINSTVNDPGSVGYLAPDDNAGIAALWVVPEDQKAASTAGLNESEASAIGKLPGVSLIMTNAAITPDANPMPSTASSVVTVPSTLAALPPVTCSQVAQSSQAAGVRRRIPDPTEPERLEVQGQVAGADNRFFVPWELRVIAQTANAHPLPAIEPLNYVFRASAGRGTWVYMIDSGVDRNHPVGTLRSKVILAFPARTCWRQSIEKPVPPHNNYNIGLRPRL